VPPGAYVLVKRFSAKEEKRRLCAAVCHPDCLPPSDLGFENHLNYYHQDGRGMPPLLAKGLAAYLNSTLVDSYFRQFSGNTQVNASDLRAIPYPDHGTLIRIGEVLGPTMPSQDELDRLVSRELPV
jgi:adenine-specific DNA-methyltransferase